MKAKQKQPGALKNSGAARRPEALCGLTVRADEY